MPKFIDFRATFAKLGNWPGNADPMRGKIVFDAACSLKPGSTIIEVGSFCGRMTSIIGAGAKNSGANKIVCVEEWGIHPPPVKLWFDKCVVLNGLADLIVPVSATNLVPWDDLQIEADLLVLSFESGKRLDAQDWQRYLKPGAKTISFVELNWPMLNPISLNHGAFVYEQKEAEETKAAD